MPLVFILFLQNTISELVGKNVILLDKVLKVCFLGIVKRLIITAYIHTVMAGVKFGVPTLF